MVWHSVGGSGAPASRALYKRGLGRGGGDEAATRLLVTIQDRLGSLRRRRAGSRSSTQESKWVPQAPPKTWIHHVSIGLISHEPALDSKEPGSRGAAHGRRHGLRRRQIGHQYRDYACLAGKRALANTQHGFHADKRQSAGLELTPGPFCSSTLSSGTSDSARALSRGTSAGDEPHLRWKYNFADVREHAKRAIEGALCWRRAMRAH